MLYLEFMLLEPIAAVRLPLYQIPLLLSPVPSLGVLPEKRAYTDCSSCSAEAGHWNKAVNKCQIPGETISKEECFMLGWGQLDLQATSTISY